MRPAHMETESSSGAVSGGELGAPLLVSGAEAPCGGGAARASGSCRLKQQLGGENFLTLIGGEMGGQDCGLGGFCLFSDTP